MIWPFGRKPKPLPPVDWPPPIIDDRMNEDWKPGDVAVCVCDGWFPGTPDDPRKGDRLRVSEVTRAPMADGSGIAIGLFFVGKPPNVGWRCFGFRKLRPDARAAESHFTAWLKETLRVPVT